MLSKTGPDASNVTGYLPGVSKRFCTTRSPSVSKMPSPSRSHARLVSVSMKSSGSRGIWFESKVTTSPVWTLVPGLTCTIGWGASQAQPLIVQSPASTSVAARPRGTLICRPYAEWEVPRLSLRLRDGGPNEIGDLLRRRPRREDGCDAELLQLRDVGRRD